METRTVSESRVTLAEVIEPTDANFLGKAFGGALLAKIDLCAYACSSKYAGTLAVTASFDRVDFHEPIEVGELVTLEGTITFVGRSSMEVTIEVFSDNLLTRQRRHTNTARVTMVALQDGKPVEVPRLICESIADKHRFLEGKLRKERRFAHRAEFDTMLGRIRSTPEPELDFLLGAKEIGPLLGGNSPTEEKP